MSDARRVPSSVFRLTYAQLEEPVAVTVLGRVIGHYVPVSVAIDDRFIAGLRPGEPASRPGQESVGDGPTAPGGSPGRPEAPDTDARARRDPPPAPQPSRGMSQAERDAVLARVSSGKKPRTKGVE